MAVSLHSFPAAGVVVSPLPAEAPMAERSPSARLRPPAGFAVTVSETAAGARVAVRGELDVLTAPRLRSVLRRCAEYSGSDVEIDLGRLEFLDARGLSVLLEIRRYLGERHRRLIIAPLSAPARRVLDLAGLTQSVAGASVDSAAQR